MKEEVIQCLQGYPESHHTHGDYFPGPTHSSMYQGVHPEDGHSMATLSVLGTLQIS